MVSARDPCGPSRGYRACAGNHLGNQGEDSVKARANLGETELWLLEASVSPRGFYELSEYRTSETEQPVGRGSLSGSRLTRNAADRPSAPAPEPTWQKRGCSQMSHSCFPRNGAVGSCLFYFTNKQGDGLLKLSRGSEMRTARSPSVQEGPGLVSRKGALCPGLCCRGQFRHLAPPRPGVHRGWESYIHDSHCAFYGLCEHEAAVLHGISKVRFRCSTREKPAKDGQESVRGTDCIYITELQGLVIFFPGMSVF